MCSETSLILQYNWHATVNCHHNLKHVLAKLVYISSIFSSTAVSLHLHVKQQPVQQTIN